MYIATDKKHITRVDLMTSKFNISIYCINNKYKDNDMTKKSMLTSFGTSIAIYNYGNKEFRYIDVYHKELKHLYNFFNSRQNETILIPMLKDSFMNYEYNLYQR